MYKSGPMTATPTVTMNIKKTGRAKHVILFNNLTLRGTEAIYHSHDCGELCMYFCIYIIMCVYCVDSVLVCVWLHWWINVFWELSKPNTWGWHLACSTLKTVSIGNNVLIPGHHKISNLSSCSCVAWDVKNFVLYIIYGRFILQNYFNLIQL